MKKPCKEVIVNKSVKPHEIAESEEIDIQRTENSNNSLKEKEKEKTKTKWGEETIDME